MNDEIITIHKDGMYFINRIYEYEIIFFSRIWRMKGDTSRSESIYYREFFFLCHLEYKFMLGFSWIFAKNKMNFFFENVVVVANISINFWLLYHIFLFESQYGFYVI